MRVARFARGAGPLDPDDGLLIAAGTPPVSDAVVASDGARWLVGWLVAGAGDTADLLAVEVLPDGTVVDATPRVLATGVARTTPSMAGRSGGGFLVLLARPAGSGKLSVDLLPVP